VNAAFAENLSFDERRQIVEISGPGY